jgi:hypothetical protein
MYAIHKWLFLHLVFFLRQTRRLLLLLRVMAKSEEMSVSDSVPDNCAIALPAIDDLHLRRPRLAS